MGFLEGLRVVDCSDERGLAAGRLLADLGADVIQVEPPGGSTARDVPPMFEGRSLFWQTYAANKRGMVADPATPGGRDRISDLVRECDIFIESEDPGRFDSLGLGWEHLRAVNPALVYVSISAFGGTGPKATWAATDLTVWASGGPLAYNLDQIGPPLRVSVPQTFLHASADAAAGALLAYRVSRRTGTGQHVDVSAQASIGLCTLAANLIAVTGDEEPEWMPKPERGVTIDRSGSGSRTRRSKWVVQDGLVELHLAMGPAAGAFTNNMFAWMADEGALPDDSIAKWDWRHLPESIEAGEIDAEAMERARQYVAAFLAGMTKQQVTEAALVRKTLAVGVADVADLASSAHFADRGFLKRFPPSDDGGPEVTVPGPFARAAATAFSWTRAAPGLERDSAPTAAAPEWTAARSTQPLPRQACTSGGLPLSGLKVADLSWVVAGPVIGRALADFGATVVRVESSKRVETARHMPPYYGGRPGPENSALYINCNAGKLGLALDLSSDGGRDVVLEMARWADVLVESFTPGQMARWGLGYETLSEANPALVMLSSSLMGNSGPYARLAGFGNIGAAMGGFQHLVGWPDRDPIGPFGPYTDFVGPRLSLVGLLAALEERERTGRGCYLDVSQVECGTWFLGPQIADYLASGTVAGRVGNRDAVCVPHGVFPCTGEGSGRADHVAVAVRDDRDFAALVSLMGRPDLARDPRYATAASRREHEDELEEIVAAWTSERNASEVEAVCQQAGIPAHRASKSADVVSDPQLAHRGHLITLPHPIHGNVVVEGPRALLSASPGAVTRAAPTMGQDRDEILSSILRMDPERIRALHESGVLE